MEKATIVTGYFELDVSKASDSKYKEWMKNMLVIDNPMVIFCDNESRDFIEEIRIDKKDKTVVIVVFDIKEFYSYKYVNEYINNYKIDKEQNVGHSPILYMIWAEKSHFLKRAIEINPFKTDYFLWVDIGCFRKTNIHYLN